ncbi:hypothetical protein [uncultured Gordonia sp.]|uniref:hypothetical protein n=1 Tax=uncultured Gordonia sp. TaxID=198437 RepID=UPI002610192D|nr:hypothetical protein [uncultured Gordonia sp.]
MNKNTTATPEEHRWGFYAAILAGFLLLSMIGNALHVWAVWGADITTGTDRGGVPVGVPIAAIVLVPVAVAVMTEMVAVASRRNRGAVRAFIVVSAAFVGSIALVTSYIGLVYVWATIVGLPTALAWMAPLIIDVPIIAATIGLWDVHSTIRADRERASRTADEVVTQLVTPDELAVELPTEAVSTAGQRRSVVGNSTVRRVTDEFEGAGDELPDELVTSGDELGVEVVTNSSPPARHPAELGVQGDELGDELPTEAPSTAGQKWSVDGNSSLPTSYRRVTDELVTPSDELGDEPDELADTGDELWLTRAAELIATTKINATPDELATVLALDEKGSSKAAIAEAAGRSRSTITGWLKAAADDADREGHPALTVVSSR